MNARANWRKRLFRFAGAAGAALGSVEELLSRDTDVRSSSRFESGVAIEER